MAEEGDKSDKTEDPTLKRLDDAHNRGDVAKSQEVSTWFVIAGGLLALVAFSGSLASSLAGTFRGLMANAHRVPMDGGGLMGLMEKLGFEVIAAIAIPILVITLAAAGGNLIQHRLVWSADQLKPKISKISPMAGVKRLFSKQALANFLKGIVKLALVGSLMVWVLWPERYRLDSLVETDVGAMLALTDRLAVKLLGYVVIVLAGIAILDYLFQYRQWFERQKMSLQEVKEEYKQTEGDPKIKARIRQIRHERSRKRMMADVPKATVIITNPTHFAIALQYERGMNAPLCVAKGADLIARKIREVATQHNIPIVENPPLARALYATVEIDSEVPAEHYKGVAEVIGYVMRLKRGARF